MSTVLEMKKEELMFAQESSSVWERVVAECKKNLVEEVADKISKKGIETEIDETKMKVISNAVGEITEDIFLNHVAHINEKTGSWTNDLANAGDIDLAEKMKAKQLGEIIKECLGEDDLAASVIKKLEGK